MPSYLILFIVYEQLRRQARLRREYLYRKSVEEKERSTYERKKKLKTALEGQCYKKLLWANRNVVYVVFILSLSITGMTTSIFEETIHFNVPWYINKSILRRPLRGTIRRHFESGTNTEKSKSACIRIGCQMTLVKFVSRNIHSR